VRASAPLTWSTWKSRQRTPHQRGFLCLLGRYFSTMGDRVGDSMSGSYCNPLKYKEILPGIGGEEVRQQPKNTGQIGSKNTITSVCCMSSPVHHSLVQSAALGDRVGDRVGCPPRPWSTKHRRKT
jgi:hypothetical protein